MIREAITAIENRIDVPLKLERKDGSVLDCMLRPLPDGATMMTFQDITDTENVERALRERNEALEAAGQMKIDFVHHVSYELRAPLTTIIGFAHFLSDPSTGPLTPKQAEYLDYVTKSTNALLALTNNILDLATIDAGAMRLELGPVDITKAIMAAAEGIQDRLATDRIRLKVEVDPNVGSFTGDERRVVQVLYNLLANAVGFSPQDGTVVVSATRTERSVVFSVSDSGPGIAPDMKDKMFDWFESRSHGSRHRGAGLGLSLVRSFVELHGGKVRVDSVVGKGTMVTCDFPTDQAQRNAAE
jgi:signal transduction histidine kinase